jgi:PAS domain S-box-containing protein
MGDSAFLTMVENSLQAKLVHVDGAPLYANPACAALYGYDDPEALLADPGFAALIAGEGQPVGEGRRRALHRDRHGGALPVLVSARAIDWSGRRAVQCAIVDLRDLSTREAELAEAKERYDLAVKGSAVGIWDQDRRTGGVHWSHRMRQILGVSPDDPRDPRVIFESLVHPHDMPGVRAAARAAFAARDLYVASFRVVRPDGSTRWVQASGRAIQDAAGNVLRFAGSAQDITADKDRERELIEARARAESEAAGRVRFLSALSHEVRTPLNVILNASNLLGDTALDARQRDLVVQTREAGRSLLRMIEDVLDLSRLETDGDFFQAGPFRIDQALESAILDHATQANDKGLAITCAIDPRARNMFIGDPTQWGRVARHLLDNAIKFTAAGAIDLRLSVGDTGHGVLLEVEDTGPGIAAKDVSAIFEPFVQLDDTIRRRVDGMGVGLALCRRLARAMGGELAVQSSPGDGAIFRFYMPYEMAATADVAQFDGLGDGLQVLVAEDNPANRRVIGLILEKLGHHATFAEDGVRCVEAFSLAIYDLVLMDLHMPEMDGYEATRRIRASGRHGARVPIVALTADARATARDEAHAAGMDDFLTKPILVEQLAVTLERWGREGRDEDGDGRGAAETDEPTRLSRSA